MRSPGGPLCVSPVVSWLKSCRVQRTVDDPYASPPADARLASRARCFPDRGPGRAGGSEGVVRRGRESLVGAMTSARERAVACQWSWLHCAWQLQLLLVHHHHLHTYVHPRVDSHMLLAPSNVSLSQ